MRSEKHAASDTSLSPKIKELQKKIQDENYINSAVDRIALVMSRHIVDLKTVTTTL